MLKCFVLLMLLLVNFAVWAAPAQFGRVDIRPALAENKLEIIDKGNAFYAQNPDWMKNGVTIQFKAVGKDWVEETFQVKAVGDGKYNIMLLGPYSRKDGNLEELYTEFGRLEVNGQLLLDGDKDGPAAVWHNTPKRLSYEAKDGEELTFKVKFRPAEGK